MGCPAKGADPLALSCNFIVHEIESESRSPGGGPFRTADRAYAIIMVLSYLMLWQLFLGSICKACKIALEVGYIEGKSEIRISG